MTWRLISGIDHPPAQIPLYPRFWPALCPGVTQTPNQAKENEGGAVEGGRGAETLGVVAV